ncbi:MAG: ATP-grasp domain-containing protein, partial [Actinomycetota bacterium]|nr:ATP-grasp domain-containing protein [Actinomycetota bacterium]
MSSDSQSSGNQITRLLVANRGEIARRIFRTASAMGIETVAIYSEGDVSAPFVAEADVAVALGGRSATDSYLDATKVLDAARRAGADAIHPGYGFLSENAAFAQAAIDAGITWVGPPPAAIAAMGDKLEAKRLMVAAQIPTLPSVELHADTDVAAEAAAIGYPVLIKAAAGGGGKGMRVVHDADGLTAAIEGAQREALNSFGNATVFLEKYLPAPRHVEIQVLGDQHGNLVHCFERECSIQRRHQKVVEEAPSPAVSPAVRDAMGAAALDAVRAIGYYSAGTVEFLLDDTDDSFYFLEVNTRLQVEHPVTEEITGLDLVREQLQVAAGHALGFAQEDLRISGHAIEVRLYAEDPANDFLPAVGTLDAWLPPAQPPARFDSGVETGSEVSVEFDPMLAKVIVHAPTRVEAARRLALVLERMTLAGVTTNRDFLVATLRHPAYLAGDTHTDFIDKYQPATRFAPADADLDTALAAAALWSQARNRAQAEVLSFMRSGYRNSVMPPQELQFALAGADASGPVTVNYRSMRDGSFDVLTSTGSTTVPRRAVLVEADKTSVTVEFDGVRTSHQVIAVGKRWHIQSRSGAVDLVQIPRFPEVDGAGVAGGQTAPMPGVIRAVSVAVGDQVASGQALVVMEAMKMEHTIRAPEDSVVAEVRCAVGDQVTNGAVLV